MRAIRARMALAVPKADRLTARTRLEPMSETARRSAPGALRSWLSTLIGDDTGGYTPRPQRQADEAAYDKWG